MSGTAGWLRACLTVGVDASLVDALEVLVHELAHAALEGPRVGAPRVRGPHGPTWRRVVVGAVRELWGIEVPVGSTYLDFDRRVVGYLEDCVDGDALRAAVAAP